MDDWNKIKRDFEPDGSLRDIYIHGIDISVWEGFISLLQASSYCLTFRHGDKLIDVPRRFSSIKSLQKTDPTIMGIEIGSGILVNCHFFCESEIELDINPKEISTESEFKVLLQFLEYLAAALERVVKVTHENSESEVIFEVG